MRNATAASCLAALASLTPLAAAAGEVGFAQEVSRNAVAELGAERRDLSAGARVREDELLTTDAFGRVSLQLFDRTLLSIGPASRMKLDRFVVRRDGTASSVVLTAAKGVFRFATGGSESRAYRINTPTATMGVRGTRFAFEVDGQGLRVSVTEGAVQVCPRGAGSAACRLAAPGRDVQVAGRRASLVAPTRPVAALAPLLGRPLAPAAAQDLLRAGQRPLGGAAPQTPLAPQAPQLPRGPDVQPPLGRDLPGGLGGAPSLPGGGLLRR